MNFARIVQTGVLVGGALGASTPVPESIKHWPSIVAAVAYALALATVEADSKAARRAIVTGLVLGVAGGIACFWVGPSRTVEVNGKWYVKGELQPEVRQDMTKRGVTERDYFVWNGKKADEVWTPKSLASNTVIIALLYSGYTGFLAFGLLGALEYLAKPSPWKWVFLALGVAALALGYLWLFKDSYKGKSTALTFGAMPFGCGFFIPAERK